MKFCSWKNSRKIPTEFYLQRVLLQIPLSNALYFIHFTKHFFFSSICWQSEKKRETYANGLEWNKKIWVCCIVQNLFIFNEADVVRRFLVTLEHFCICLPLWRKKDDTIWSFPWQSNTGMEKVNMNFGSLDTHSNPTAIFIPKKIYSSIQICAVFFFMCTELWEGERFMNWLLFKCGMNMHFLRSNGLFDFIVLESFHQTFANST